MINFEPIKQLMNSRMDRRQFLKHLLMMLVAMMGISAFIRTLTDPLGKKETKASHGYGGTPYGQ